MASIKLDRVTRTFGTKTAVNSVSLEVPDREFLVLLGPSGCGKSTLLRMLAGLESVSSGEIHLDKRRVDQLPPSARDMAFVFQSYALYPHMTVRRNITFPLIMREFKWWFHLPIIGGMAKRKVEESENVRELVGRTTKILALTEMLDQFPRTLSGGQRQRVALGRAMVRQPEVFLMDEPLSNLDAKLRMSMRAEIIKLHRDVGGTFVYVTHDQIEAMTMGTKIALMRDGVVQQFGTPREIYRDPANTFVARFIGAPPMNLIEARIERGSLRIGGVTFALPAHLAGLVSEQPQVLLGIRPNAMTVVTGGEGMLAGKVALVEHIGAESVIDVRLDQATTAHREEGEGRNEVKITESGYSDLLANDDISVKVDLNEAVLFSPDSGLRLRPEPGGAAPGLAS